MLESDIATASENKLLASLRQYRQWVCYRSKDDKQPLKPDGSNASSADPATWSTYEAAIAAGMGIGFVLTPELGIVCIDLDVAEGADLAEFQKIILHNPPLTYIETSPSGRGFHIWMRGTLPDNRGIKATEYGVELYNSGRYMTVTFDAVIDAPLQNKQPLIDELIAKFKPLLANPTVAIAQDCKETRPREQILNDLGIGPKRQRFSALWSADSRGLGYTDSSKGDAELCRLLMEHGATNSQAESIWLESKLATIGLDGKPRKQDKVRKRADYRQSTITDARAAVMSNPQTNKTNAPQIDETGTGAWASVIPLVHGPSIAPEPDVKWIIPGIIPYGHVTAIHAMSGVGKTTFALALAASLSNPSNTALKTGPVLILTNEDTAARYRKRFLELGGVDDNFYCIDLNTTQAVWMLDDVARLENTLRLKPWALVVIDSLYSHKPSKYDIETKHADAAKLLLPLVPLAEKYCPILVIHHDNKQDTRTAAQKTSGSHGIASSIRHHVRVSIDPDNKMRRIVTVFNTKIGSMQAKALVFEMEPFKWASEMWMDVDADEIVQAPHEPRKASGQVDKAALFLEMELAQGPQLASVIKTNAEKVGIAEMTLQRARQRKGIASIQLGKADGFVYLWGFFNESVNKDAITLSMFPHLRPQLASR